jgi:multiple sugar transport system ATP-binding protein
MVRRPTAFLMDEPLSNLDARLRAQTRTEIADLHRRLGVTFVYVTHDQAEAMTMSDRVAVMSAGRILQIGRPHEIYVAPADTTVARLVGTPRMNLMAGVVRCGTIDVAGASLPIAVDSAAGTAVIVGFRPENAAVMHRPEPGALAGRVRSVEHMGPDVFVHVDIPGHAEGAIVRCAPADYSALSTDRIVHMAIATEHALVFDAGGKRIVATSHQACSLKVRA